jgi:hypothetical protein
MKRAWCGLVRLGLVALDGIKAGANAALDVNRSCMVSEGDDFLLGRRACKRGEDREPQRMPHAVAPV